MSKAKPIFTLFLGLYLIILLINLIFPLSSFSQTEEEEETLTIATYYPAPYGIYNEMQTNKMAVGDVNNSGKLDAGDQPPANGQLYTARSVIYKPQSSLPAFDVREGELVYSDTDNKFYYYDGSSWVAQGGGGGCYVSYSGGCLTGFTNKGSAGWYGACGDSSGFYLRPPGGGCYPGWAPLDVGEAYVCCQ